MVSAEPSHSPGVGTVLDRSTKLIKLDSTPKVCGILTPKSRHIRIAVEFLGAYCT